MLYILPGMGVDHTMYRGAWRELPDARFLDWPRYEGETSLAEVAERLLASLSLAPTDILCGTSMGGMVALEMSLRMPVRRVILVSSAISPREINPFLRALSPLSCTPFMWVGKQMVRFAGRPTSRMMKATPARFLNAMCRAIVRWDGYHGSGEIVRIHGDSDWMIGCPADAQIVHSAGHLAAITHPAECAALVRQALDANSSPQG